MSAAIGKGWLTLTETAANQKHSTSTISAWQASPTSMEVIKMFGICLASSGILQLGALLAAAEPRLGRSIYLPDGYWRRNFVPAD